MELCSGGGSEKLWKTFSSESGFGSVGGGGGGSDSGFSSEALVVGNVRVGCFVRKLSSFVHEGVGGSVSCFWLLGQKVGLESFGFCESVRWSGRGGRRGDLGLFLGVCFPGWGVGKGGPRSVLFLLFGFHRVGGFPAEKYLVSSGFGTRGLRSGGVRLSPSGDWLCGVTSRRVGVGVGGEGGLGGGGGGFVLVVSYVCVSSKGGKGVGLVRFCGGELGGG